MATPVVASPAPPARDQELRLATIGYRLAVASANLCARPQQVTGLLLHELGQYGQSDRAGVARSFGLGDGFGVLNVVPASAAARAGLQRGDEIVGINGRDLRTAFRTAPSQSGDYDRMEAFNGFLDATLAAGPATLSVTRGGAVRQVVVTADRGCGGAMSLTRSSALNAWSDGRYVAITTRLADFARDDDELAFVVAHEMSHNILEHGTKHGRAENGLFASGMSHATGIKSEEMEADRYAIRLMARASFDLSGASHFLEHSARLRWMDLPLTHPSITRRLQIVAAAEADLLRSAQATPDDTIQGG